LLICRLLGIPIVSRVAGSDLPAAIQRSTGSVDEKPLRIVFMGGGPGVGERARDVVNAGPVNRLLCVGAIDPGVLKQKTVNGNSVALRINDTEADFLLVALGAQKGQAWLMQNMHLLKTPVFSHLGATLNFLAGTIIRAPIIVRRFGLEWLWRIFQEPRLAQRYAADGSHLLWILLTRILPLGLWLRLKRIKSDSSSPTLKSVPQTDGQFRINFKGPFNDSQLNFVSDLFRTAAGKNCNITLDFSGLTFFEMGFAGKVLMLEKILVARGKSLVICGPTRSVLRALNWCGLAHLVE
jgi:N-acetylglucosaminyldiphosphoundecaprenol N-acetyl-beta-D-mannosaminyltransferase